MHVIAIFHSYARALKSVYVASVCEYLIKEDEKYIFIDDFRFCFCRDDGFPSRDCILVWLWEKSECC